MTAPPRLSRTDFEQLLAAHERVLELANEVEYQLYRLGEAPADSPVTECQQATGALLGLLREVLFRHDQRGLPLLDGLTAEGSC
jgi:hypothetical protein